MKIFAKQQIFVLAVGGDAIGGRLSISPRDSPPVLVGQQKGPVMTATDFELLLNVFFGFACLCLFGIGFLIGMHR